MSIIQSGVPLNDKNWFRTGGKARFFAQPHSIETFCEALQFSNTHDLPLFLLGNGANVLISDTGFDGIVIQPQLKDIALIKADNNTVLVTAGSGVLISDLIHFCLNNQILGLEEFSGIPGTVGGSVYINLHYFQFLLSQFLASASVINRKTGVIETVDTSWFDFGYNTSRLQSNTHYLLNATFKLRYATVIETAHAQGRSIEIIRHRKNRYPNSNTCGSFFRNFLEHEITLIINDKKMTFVAYYLDKIGIKGALSVGDAIVSYQHANMIINRGNATSNDIITVARSMQEQVVQHYGIIPRTECILVGFESYPLLDS